METPDSSYNASNCGMIQNVFRLCWILNLCVFMCQKLFYEPLRQEFAALYVLSSSLVTITAAPFFFSPFFLFLTLRAFGERCQTGGCPPRVQSPNHSRTGVRVFLVANRGLWDYFHMWLKYQFEREDNLLSSWQPTLECPCHLVSWLTAQRGGALEASQALEVQNSGEKCPLVPPTFLCQEGHTRLRVRRLFLTIS